jgi:hypothetical protein
MGLHGLLQGEFYLLFKYLRRTFLKMGKEYEMGG